MVTINWGQRLWHVDFGEQWHTIHTETKGWTTRKISENGISLGNLHKNSKIRLPYPLCNLCNKQRRASSIFSSRRNHTPVQITCPSPSSIYTLTLLEYRILLGWILVELFQIVTEYGATAGSSACQTKGMPWLNPLASNVLACTCALNSFIDVIKLAAAVCVAVLVASRNVASLNMLSKERSESARRGRALQKQCQHLFLIVLELVYTHKSASSSNCTNTCSSGGRKSTTEVFPLVVGMG